MSCALHKCQLRNFSALCAVSKPRSVAELCPFQPSPQLTSVPGMPGSQGTAISSVSP